MTLKTKSGSYYLITMRDDKMYLLRGAKEYLVDKITFGIGLPLEVACHELNSITCQVGSETVTIRSTPIVEIRF